MEFSLVVIDFLHVVSLTKSSLFTKEESERKAITKHNTPKLRSFTTMKLFNVYSLL